MLISKVNDKFITYVGYTKNIKKRLLLHNNSLGAKFTRGRKWELIYRKKYSNKSSAMKGEYSLKKDKKKRNHIKLRYINKK